MAEISEPLENYLKEIYELEELKGHARVSDLILIFGVSPGTISSALAKLERMNLVTRKDRKINLTEEGKKLAEKLIRAHRLSERLLTDIIGIDWVRAHEIAHRLEHVWPDDVLERLDEILGRPRTCPHGHPIPGRVGKVEGVKLSEARPGKYRVVMIIREEEWVLRRALELGLFPGKEVRVMDKGKIEVDGKVHEIENALAEQVLVNGTE
ncbi:MAG: metal-dependent transcriptional regulator [Sulfolobales archaeon]|nr:metal-dependent transcriptional regulator [Sulfolobales archaeon]MCG2883970.1 metal-dependent transcriptional regulator [Sulfolobales archaeon]MCG2908813.1 metal-dependent transcriptional regulator [Sulfolobales archaeon]MCQ4335459.1 metal-dependent transcriptional regulator [Sulfolobales archaeon]